MQVTTRGRRWGEQLDVDLPEGTPCGTQFLTARGVHWNGKQEIEPAAPISAGRGRKRQVVVPGRACKMHRRPKVQQMGRYHLGRVTIEVQRVTAADPRPDGLGPARSCSFVEFFLGQ